MRSLNHLLRDARRRGGSESGAQWSTCYAPHASMYFDQFGKARACCQNSEVVLGDVTRQSIREMWGSADAERLRSALEAHDYSAGCSFCEWQVREGNEAILFSRGFDGLAPTTRRPTWPTQMEFSLTNTCNLACTMCNGDWSSTIRSKREARKPLPAAYGAAFFEQLAEFLPHLTSAKFLGGEPFLGSEPLRVMEMLAELPEPPKVTITTNGTIGTARVWRIIDRLRPSIVVSLDGASATTYESIRVGARFADVVANLDRFIDVLGADSVSLTHCLMTTNWHEYHDLLRMAEDRDLAIFVNTVRFPGDQSLYHLEADELAPIVAALRRTAVDLTGQRRDMWDGHLGALAHRLDVVSSSSHEQGPVHGLPGAPLSEMVGLDASRDPLPPDGIDRLRSVLLNAHPDGLLELDQTAGVITEVRASAAWSWLRPDALVGTVAEELPERLAHSISAAVTVTDLPNHSEKVTRFAVRLDLPDGIRSFISYGFECEEPHRSGAFLTVSGPGAAD